MKISRYVQAFLPAAVLAALVLFVFSTLQYYGPESAVRRFVEAIATGNDAEFDEVTIAPTSDREAVEIARMRQRLGDALSNGYKIRLRDVDREPDRVDVTVYLYNPDGTALRNGTFVAERTRIGWQVSVHRTFKLWNSLS